MLPLRSPILQLNMLKLSKIVFSFLLLFTVATHKSWAQFHPRYLSLSDSSSINISEKKHFVIQLEHENGGVLTGNERAKESLRDAYYNAFNLKIGWQTKHGGDVYHQLYNYPVYGVGLYSSTFGLDHVGDPYAVYGFVSIPIKPRVNRRWNFNYRISLGLSGRFNPYSEDENPFNLIIGTKNNVFIDFGGQVNYTLSRHFQIGAGLAFHHFSNGALKLPNTGINLLPFTAAVTYVPNAKTFDFRKQYIAPNPKEDELQFSYAFGFKQLDEDNERKYFKSTIGVFWSRYLGYKWRLGLGANIFYSASANDPEVAGDKESSFNALFSGGPAFYIDHLLTSKLYLNGNVGYYLHRNEFNRETKPMYLRIGGRYYVYKDFFAGVSIKAHAGKADFIEWTTGYTLDLRKRK
ncbi:MULTISPECIES: acyloxyacyl hydrolase [Olivibacter]|uniref:Acyloxyacyl hydrolase n=1 Tax=Olivibacter jilunii TaxID=985016 RepID=A0ABW6B6M8_9SPHI|nr:acyloxyacyl hydrolase [Olivibacter sp. UJ_SKK_5.1]MDX3915733.1 acyloxyacyl hydrolase [Pseudosphingobacterium sp.]